MKRFLTLLLAAVCFFQCFRTPVHAGGPAKAFKGCVALTFDDGPSGPITEKLLDALAARGVKATFFVCGYRIGQYPDTLCRAAKVQINWYFGLPVGVAAVSSLFGVRALFTGMLTAQAQRGITEMMIAAGAMILLLCVVEWLYMAAVKRTSSRYLLGVMAPEREE